MALWSPLGHILVRERVFTLCSVLWVLAKGYKFKCLWGPAGWKKLVEEGGTGSALEWAGPSHWGTPSLGSSQLVPYGNPGLMLPVFGSSREDKYRFSYEIPPVFMLTSNSGFLSQITVPQYICGLPICSFWLELYPLFCFRWKIELLLWLLRVLPGQIFIIGEGFYLEMCIVLTHYCFFL